MRRLPNLSPKPQTASDILSYLYWHSSLKEFLGDDFGQYGTMDLTSLAIEISEGVDGFRRNFRKKEAQ